MPPDVTNMLSEKIDAVRDDLSERMDRMDAKLETLNVHMLRNPLCPAPGSCVNLAGDLRAGMIRVEKLENRILAIEKWQARMMGIGATLIVVATLFGPAIRRALNLE